MSKSKAVEEKIVDAKIDKGMFFGGGGLVILILAFLVVSEDKSAGIMQGVFNFLTDQMGPFYIWGAMISFGVMAWLAFGKYKDVKFGGPEAKTEFSTASWIAMFFCSGIGTSLLAWASKEWYYYYVTPPFGIEPMSSKAAEMAAAYPMFHWGILGWAIYGIMAFPIGYAYWNRKEKALKFSTACSGVIGKKAADGFIGKAIDFLLIFGLIGANATSLASGTPMLAESVSLLFKIEHTFTVDVVVILIWTAIFTVSVTLGLKKGIKVLSDVNLVGVLILCSFIFIVGPTWFIINSFTDSVGIVADNFFRMAFYTDSIAKTMFPQWWTVFYWAWYFAYAPYMGTFIARISRGRSFRQVTFGVIGGGTAACVTFFAIFGGNAMFQHLNGSYDFVTTAQTTGDFTAVVGSLMTLPWSNFLLVVFCFVGFVYSATTIDSSAYTMATVACKDLQPGQEPSRINRMFWALLLGGAALVVMNIGGLTSVKTAALVVAFPILIFVLMSIISLMKWLKEDQPHLIQLAADNAKLQKIMEEKNIKSAS